MPTGRGLGRVWAVEKLRMGVDNGAGLFPAFWFSLCRSGPLAYRANCFSVAGKVSAVGFCQSILDFRDLPIVERLVRLRSSHAGAPKRTETNFETPGSCMVTP